MVESKARGFELMVKDTKLMTVIILLPFLKISDLVRFCRLNKACYHLMQKKVKYEVLFQA